MNLIGKCIAGSRLYELHSDQSDYDYKAIFLPPLRDCILMEASKSENYKLKDGEHGEYEGFALQRFLRLAANSEDIVITMLHAKGNKILVDSDIYKFLRDNKSKFYTKQMIGALGYAKSMAFKYGFRADRMAAVEKCLNALKAGAAKGVAKVYQMWDDLPQGEHIIYDIDERNNNTDKRFMEVAGKKIQSTVAVVYAIEILQAAYDRFGSRVQIAKSMDGNDVKALSHSFRVGFQLRAIYNEGGFEYPLRESSFIRDVKYGILDFEKDNLDIKLNDLIKEVEELSIQSNFPDKVDKSWLDEIVLNAYQVSGEFL
jgi:hypothetical protein